MRGRATAALGGSALGVGTLLAWFGATSCGGTQTPAQATATMADASADAGTLLAENDACAIQRSYVYKSIAGYDGLDTFDLAPTSGSNNGSYVSYDFTGQLFGCLTNCSSMPEDQELLVDASPIDNNYISQLQCKTGYNAVPERLPAGDQGHCLIDGGHAAEGVHLRATNLAKWGMNLGVDLRQNCYGGPNYNDDPTQGSVNGSPCDYDARSWTGISFWARLGSTDSVTNAIITIGDPETAGTIGGTYPFNALLCGDLPCVPDSGPPAVHGPQPCDPFGKAITLDGTWQFFRVPFSEMAQKGYGLPEPGPDLAHFLQVKLNLSRGQIGSSDYDIWINDISFYK